MPDFQNQSFNAMILLSHAELQQLVGLIRMPDNLSAADRKRAMQAVKGKRTSLERRLHSMLAARHIRGWHSNEESLPGKPDFVFPNEKIIIFVDGCFWHGCPYCNRPLPETNRDYWQRKINRNKERDSYYESELQKGGWIVFRIWEHELLNMKNARIALDHIVETLAEQNAQHESERSRYTG